MPKTDAEAKVELAAMVAERDITFAQFARRIGRNEMWVSRKVKGSSPVSLSDYSLMKSALDEIPPNRSLKEGE